MLEQPLRSISDFVRQVAKQGGADLTTKQHGLLATLLTGMILLGSFKVKGISALFLSKLTPAAIYAMLRRGNIPFDKLFWGALKLIIKAFNVRVITIAVDDTERERSKNCKVLPFVRKALCKATGGWIQAQNIVFIVLVTDRVTIPVWFSFHRPANLSKDQRKACRKNPKKIKKYDSKYRTKVDLACIGLFIVARMIKRLQSELGIQLKIKCASGDNGYASAKIQTAVSKLFGCQYVSKANPNQNVFSRGTELSLEKFFTRISLISKTIVIRGREIAVEFKPARVFVSSYNRKVFVVAIRYSGEKSWQYLFGTDLTWTAESIIKAYGLRWLIEVFFEDWKQCDGWGVGALQRSVDGAVRGLFLSLLVDLFLLYYQCTNSSLREHGRVELYSAGTVIRHLQAEAIYESIEGILEHENPREKLRQIREQLIVVSDRRVSLKHGDRFKIDELGPSPNLENLWGYRNRVERKKQRLAQKAA